MTSGQLSSLRKPGAQDPTGPGSRLHLGGGASGPADCDPERSLPLGYQAGIGERFTVTSKPGLGQQVAFGEGLWSPTGHSPWPVPTSQKPGELEGPREEGWDLPLPLSLCLPGDHHSIDCWLTTEPLMKSLTDSWLL